MKLKRLLSIFLFVFIPLIAFGAGFEGKIEFVKKSYYDTNYYVYHVKDNMVRIEEYNANRQKNNTLLVNLESGKIYAINPDRKLYKELEPKNGQEEHTTKGNYKVLKTGNTKTINGFECRQWRVRNKQKDTEIAYWVTKNSFSFFEKLSQILGKFGNCSDFFVHIPNNEGYLPILAVERNLVRYEKRRLVVTNIDSDTPKKDIFKIPEGYKHYKH